MSWLVSEKKAEKKEKKSTAWRYMQNQNNYSQTLYQFNLITSQSLERISSKYFQANKALLKLG